MGGVNTAPDYVTTMDIGYATCVEKIDLLWH